MAAPEFRNDDEAAQYFLSTLRDGTRAEKIVARDGLAAIFSRRGLFEEAAELYELNIRAGARTPELFEQLSGVYHELGDDESADAALSEARRQRLSASARPRPATSAAAPAPPSATQRMLQFPGGSGAENRPGPGSPAPAAPVRGGSGARVGGPLTGGGAARGSTAAAVSHELELDALPDPAPRADHAAVIDSPPDVTARLPVQWPAAETATLPGTGRAETATLPGSGRAEAPPMPRTGRAEAAQRSRRPGSLPTPLMVLAVVLVMIVLPVALLAVLVVNPIALYLEGRAAGPTVDAVAGAPAPLKIAPGATSAWYIQTGRSVSGLWATPGLELTLDQDIDGAGRDFAVTGARPQSWGETITIVERRGQGRANQLMVVPATFDAPRSLPPSGTVLDGHIAGQVTAPRLSETSQFNTTTESVDVPVRLIVVSTPALWLDRFVNAVGMYFDEERWLLVTIGALLAWCILAGAAAIVFRFGQR